MRHLANAQYWDRPAGGNTGRLFLAFGGPVCADRISNCPLDRVLTYKNLIYLLNLQFVFLFALLSLVDKILLDLFYAWVILRDTSDNCIYMVFYSSNSIFYLVNATLEIMGWINSSNLSIKVNASAVVSVLPSI